MRCAMVYFFNKQAGILEESEIGKKYNFKYLPDYAGPAISLKMPLVNKSYEFENFPPFFDGLLPEGKMLEGLLKQKKIDRNDYFSQLVCVGQDLVGAVTVEEIK